MIQVAILRLARGRRQLNRPWITRQVQGAAIRDADRAVHLLARHGAVILREDRLEITDVGSMLLKNFDAGAANPHASRESRRRQVILARRLFQRA